MDKDFLLNKAYFFLKFRLRTEKEIRDYLYKKIINTHYSRDDVEEVIKNLKEQGLINDEKFIEAYVNDQLSFKPKGKKFLINKLKQKGINEKLIEKFFSENQIDEEKLAFEILKKRWLRLKDLSFEKRYQKAMRFLLGRGFNFSLAKKTFEKLNTS